MIHDNDHRSGFRNVMKVIAIDLDIEVVDHSLAEFLIAQIYVLYEEVIDLVFVQDPLQVTDHKTGNPLHQFRTLT